MEQKSTEFKSIIVRLASPERILSWSHGEVTKPETINYRTQRAEKDGLFDERIFGPEKDYECYCGKYRRIRYKGIVCDKCGVEVTKSIVRRERMGHIKLATPVAHIWFVRGVPSKIGLVLDMSITDLERVVYFAGYIVTKVDEKLRLEMLKKLDRDYKDKLKLVKSAEDKSALKDAKDRAKSELDSIKSLHVLNEVAYHRLSLRYGEIFEAETGAEALYNICKNIDLAKMEEDLQPELEAATPQNAKKIFKRLRLIRSFKRAGIRPEWMFLEVIPIIPPALRPMVALDGGRHATSDVNDLYRRVINRNNRLKKLLELRAPEVIVRNEKRMLQEAVDALIDNSMRRGQAAVSPMQKAPLRSLADMLKGKQGRFRQNLLGKRVDYSGRSVIVVGSDLSLDQCGLPKHMALELFRPFVIQKLRERELAYNVRGANRLIDEQSPEVWGMLEEVIANKFVLLNRAPTLHRLGIQAFKPVLIEGNAIQLHPLVCQAFNADFDGDQMAVHVPLTVEAQREAREIMNAAKNLLKPGTGEPITNPTQDMVLGCYWLTKIKPGVKGAGSIFSSPNEALLAYDMGYVDVQAPIKVRATKTSKYHEYAGSIFETSPGRLLFNSVLPDDFLFLNEEVKKSTLGKIVRRLIARYGSDATPAILDKIKDFGFKYATTSGISWGMEDLKVPEIKNEVIKKAQAEAKVVQDQYEEGLLTDNERYRKIVEIWSNVKRQIDEAVPQALDPMGSVHNMVSSAARGNWSQVAQMSGMKGLVRNPSGKIIELPIIASYKEGLNVLEYFISTHGARKGTADTALKTAAAGYLTRRLVDVAQDVIVQDEDCKTKDGVQISRREGDAYGKKLSSRIFGRTLARDIKDNNGKTWFKAGHLLSIDDAEAIESSEVESVIVRSPIMCRTLRGVCSACYGYDLGNNEQVPLGSAVGIVAAQAIGEPGTQLTMRTFHTGGVAAAGDITLGLPRIEEIFELRTPENPALISDVDGEVLEIEEKDREKVIKILISDVSGKDKKGKSEIKDFAVPFGGAVLTQKGEQVKKGDLLSEGSADIGVLYKIAGDDVAQNYILNEVSKIYSLQGASINDKHIEVIIRQMFSRVMVENPGTSRFSNGDIVEKSVFITENERVKKEGGETAKGEVWLKGITKVALTTSSFLSAASFQETSKVLINAACEGKEDKLLGLKENVIVGHLIPAGTSFKRRKRA
ncbi:MAG: DNA-directed RNA polymerase subunit beta' [Patescibacteria group bacterium]